jgi:hypothetical protein
MAFRRNREQAERQRAWERFRQQHIDEIRRIGLTETVTRTQERFVDFLMHGYLDHHDDPSGFSVHQMWDEQHALLVEFTNRFMAEFGQLSEFELIALRLARFPRRVPPTRGDQKW